MAKTKISEYDAISANNTDVDSINIAEGCAPSGINNAIREVMAHLKDFQTGASGDSLTVGGNLSVTGTVTIPDNAISGDKVEGGTINAITINTLTAGQANFGDNDKAIFGAGSDLQIYHDGTTSKIDGAVTLTSNVTLGDASTDTVKVNGYMGVGGAADPTIGIYVQNTPTSTAPRGVRSSPTFSSSATANGASFISAPLTQAVAFTIGDVYHFRAVNPTKGAGSTITNLHGLYIDDQTQGTNNYGITSAVSSGTNKWNIYASGTAANYFEGQTAINTTTTTGLLTIQSASNDPYSHAEGPQLVLLNAGSRKANIFSQNTGTGNSGDGLYLDSYDISTTNGKIVMRQITTGGVANERFKLAATEAVFNDPGNDYDFRIESDTNSHAFFLEGSTGNVGIGTSSPGALLDVSSTAPAIRITNTSDKTWAAEDEIGRIEFYSKDFSSPNGTKVTSFIKSISDIGSSVESGALTFGTSPGASASVPAFERMRLDSAGNLGLGVTPSAWGGGYKALQVSNQIFTGTSAQALQTQNAYYDGANWRYISTAHANYLEVTGGEYRWNTAPSGTAGNPITFNQAMTLDASGNLGVGTTSPALLTTNATTLHVHTPTAGKPVGIYLTNADTGATASDGTTLVVAATTGDFDVIQRESANVKIYTAGTERLRIDASGNVGIGTSSPVYKLHVKQDQAAYTWGRVDNQSSSASAYAGWMLGAYGNSWGIAIGSSAANSNALSFVLDAGGGNVERMRLDSAGNLGLGVTPSGWGSAYKALDVNTRGLSFGGGTDSGAISVNAYWNLGWKYAGTSTYRVSQYQQFDGSHAWHTAPSGTAGDTISFTQAMTLTAAGYLLIKATSFAGNGISISPPDASGVYSTASGTVGINHYRFANDNGVVGGITTSGTATTYNTSSDYRLKNTIAPMTGALAKVTALKPVTYKWNADGSDGEGFIAHELAEVVPQCVTGEKDAVDAEGNPVYQGIDTSFLVATLTAAIQEQQAIIESLTARVSALEGN